MFGFLKKILGSKSDKDLKEIYPLVDKINTEFDKLKGISDEDLRGKTESFKLKIKESLKETDDEIKSLKNKYEVSEGSLDEKEEILNSIDKILEDQNKTIENVLNEILPEAFAVVKETARRFSENGSLEVMASDYDKALSENKENIKIKGSKALWLNKWEAAGVSLSLIHI